MKKLLLLAVAVFIISCGTTWNLKETVSFSVKDKAGNTYQCRTNFQLVDGTITSDNECGFRIVDAGVVYDCKIALANKDKAFDQSTDCKVVN